MMAGILITEGAGYVGNAFVWACRDAGVPFAILDDLSTGTLESLPPDCPSLVARVSDRAAVTTLVRRHDLSSIAHFAGSILVDESLADPEKYYQNNFHGSRALLDTAAALGIRHFVFSSTAAVYGESSSGVYSEITPTLPATPYGDSKLMIEELLKEAARASTLRFVTLRYFNVAGADSRLRTGPGGVNASNLVKTCCDVAGGRRQSLVIFGNDYPTRDGTCVRDFVHVSDVANAGLKALSYLEAGGESTVLNCAHERAIRCGKSAASDVQKLRQFIDA